MSRLILIFVFFSFQINFLVAFEIRKGPNDPREYKSETLDNGRRTIRKGPNDPREYKSETLENGLRTIFISDPLAEKSAVNLAVNVGSFAEPKKYNGIAHYLEHILFLGSKKYPQISDFQRFVEANSGSVNAETQNELTKFYFSILPPKVRDAMDRLSGFFIEPLFDRNYLDKERHAVDSEYHVYFSNDEIREYMLLKNLVNPLHPFHRFNIGNLDTLPGPNSTIIELRDAAIQFYNKHYLIENMMLVVGGPQSIAEFREIANRTFGNIKRSNGKHQQPPVDDSTVPLFNKHQLPQMVEMEILGEDKKLDLIFLFPTLRNYYKAKPEEFVIELITSTHPDGLYDHLKWDLAWIKSLSASRLIVSNRDSLFSIFFSLTDEGANHIDEIITETFRYIHQIQSSGIDLERFIELRKVKELELDFYDSPEIFEAVSKIAENAFKFPIEDVVVHDFLYTEFRKSVIIALLDRLVPENVLVMIGRKNIDANSVEPWLRVRHKTSKISLEMISKWSSPAKTDVPLKLRNKNQFIADVNEIINDKQHYTNITGKPELIVDQGSIKVWCMNAHPYDESPKTDFYLILSNENLQKTARNAVLLELFISLVNDNLLRNLSSAIDAGNGFDLSSHWRGLKLHATGYKTSVMEKIVREMVKIIRHFKIEQKKFTTEVKSMQQAAESSLLETPIFRMIQESKLFLVEPAWSNQDLNEELKNLTSDELVKFVKDILFGSTTTAEAFVFGRYDCNKSNTFAEIVKNGFGITSGKSNEFKRRLVKLEGGSATTFDLRTNHSDNAVIACYEPPSATYKSTVTTILLALMYSTDFFTDLRTNQQLGYIVTVIPQQTIVGAPLLCFAVESANYESGIIWQNIDNFVNQIWKNLNSEGIDNFTLGEYKNSLKQLFLQKPVNRTELLERMWLEIVEGEYQFNRNEKLVAAIDPISSKVFIEYFQELVDPKRRRLLLMKTRSNVPKNATMFKGFQSINGYQDLKTRTGQSFYEVVKEFTTLT